MFKLFGGEKDGLKYNRFGFGFWVLLRLCDGTRVVQFTLFCCERCVRAVQIMLSCIVIVIMCSTIGVTTECVSNHCQSSLSLLLLHLLFLSLKQTQNRWYKEMSWLETYITYKTKKNTRDTHPSAQSLLTFPEASNRALLSIISSRRIFIRVSSVGFSSVITSSSLLVSSARPQPRHVEEGTCHDKHTHITNHQQQTIYKRRLRAYVRRWVCDIDKKWRNYLFQGPFR